MNFSVIKMEKEICTIRDNSSGLVVKASWDLVKLLKPTSSKYLYELPEFTGKQEDDLTKILPIYYKARNNNPGSVKLLGIIVKKFMKTYFLNQNDFLSLFNSFVTENIFVGEN